MFYEDFHTVLSTLLFWWLILLVFQRVTNRFPKKNTWKKDIILTFFQSIMILILLPVLFDLFK
ncbi:hypothetical protein [Neobacillus sp. D3-1R]|uniref:hypothetical protein n=1 Tax=Neobacillus sp. D3-1R TaxID=3445778 RepID=UPI003F9EFC7E